MRRQGGRGRPFKKGEGGRPPGVLNKVKREARALAMALVGDEKYLAKLTKAVQARTIHHSTEQMLWHYAYGKPLERVKLMGVLGTFDLVQALQEAAKLRGADPRRVLAGDGHSALPNGVPSTGAAS
jgi:hypothetical protein